MKQQGIKHIGFLCIILIWSGISTRGFCGEKLSVSEVDVLTYRLYSEGKWDSLIITGKEALKGGIDFFYLRARMGAAYFERGQFAQAVTQYRKAQKFNDADPYVNQSLVVSLQRLGQTEQAIASSSALTASGEEKLGIKTPILRNLAITGNMTWSNAGDQLRVKQLMGRDSICGYRDLYKNYYGGDIDLSFGLSRHLFLDVGYSYFTFQKQLQYQYAWYEDSLVRRVDTTWGFYNIWAFPRYATTNTFDYTVNQQEFYLAPRLVTNNGWRVEPLFHLVYGKYHQTRMDYSMEARTDTVYHVDQPVEDSTFTFYQDIYGFTQKDTSYTNFLLSLRVAKRWGIMGVGIQGSWSDFNGGTQGQVGIDIQYYPLGNPNFYGLTRGIGLFRTGDLPDFVFQETLGVKLTKWLWLEGTAIYGDYSNGSLANGRWVYNLSDRIRYSVAGSLIFTLLKEMSVTATFLHSGKSNPWYQVNLTNQDVPPNHVTTNTTLVDYHTNSIIVELRWDF
jgi:hypothetical protein